MKIKSFLSAEELKAFYDKGIALQNILFELYEQDVNKKEEKSNSNHRKKVHPD